MTDLIIVLVTVGDEVVAGRIARKVLNEKLAACVNIIPNIHSIYRWEGTIEGGSESLMIIKTSRELLDDLKDLLHVIHPYDVPEFMRSSPRCPTLKNAVSINPTSPPNANPSPSSPSM